MIEITTELVSRLIREQFPEWSDLEIRPVEQSGHDNRTFHLGGEMTVRLPGGEEYVPQIEKEAKWLPFLAKHLSLPISSPIATGRPTAEYPFVWSVNRYLEGETANGENISDKRRFAGELAAFLKELQSLDTSGAPVAGKHNFFRGAHPGVYSGQVYEALEAHKSSLPTEKLRALWELAVSSKWKRPPVWVHGDVAPGNLLVKDGSLCGVIDFGIMGIGDPACDYAMAWTFFDKESRKDFLRELDCDTIDRARGWALWKALITCTDADEAVAENAGRTLHELVDEYDKIEERKKCNEHP
ncbi:MAG TPA: aminoglycoside phosphotransferase family protein [Candidatus Eisenbergiella merdavium]|uniref:Aminoglycoside phosphotransferase family protein n=1 Tax=Candidatus Eisenbergiella merdavium TaxID=2838551 RepID=A0A9D2NDI1_9FIRM|nr:aminoglycoside phosphotransferase family protein [Candidatus Eisenbergiella merdavium]